MIELNPSPRIADLSGPAACVSWGTFDYYAKRERLEEVTANSKAPTPERPVARADPGRERSLLDKTVNGILYLTEGLDGAKELRNSSS